MKEEAENRKRPEKLAIVVAPQAFLYDEDGEIVDEVFSGWAVAVLPYLPEYTLDAPSGTEGIEVLTEAERERYSARPYSPLRVRVRTHYGYEGFINPDCLAAFSSYEAKHRDRLGRTVTVSRRSADILLAPKVQSPILRTLPRGAFLALLDDLVRVPGDSYPGEEGEGGTAEEESLLRLSGKDAAQRPRDDQGNPGNPGEDAADGLAGSLPADGLAGGLPADGQADELAGGLPADGQADGLAGSLPADGQADGLAGGLPADELAESLPADGEPDELVQSLLEEDEDAGLSAALPDEDSADENGVFEVLDDAGIPDDLQDEDEARSLSCVPHAGYVRVMTADGRVGFIATSSVCRRADSDGLFYDDPDGMWLTRQVSGRRQLQDGIVTGTETDGAKERADAGHEAEERRLRARIVHNAKTYLGTQYRWGGHSGEGIDCSGLALMSYMMSGILIWRDAAIREGYPVHRIDPEQKKPGDLLYFPGHVAIYLGDGRYIHSTGREGDFGVVIGSLIPGEAGYRADLEGKCCAVGSIF